MSPHEELSGLRTILHQESAVEGCSLETKPRYLPQPATHTSQQLAHVAQNANLSSERQKGEVVAHASCLSLTHQGLVLGPKLAQRFPSLARASTEVSRRVFTGGSSSGIFTNSSSSASANSSIHDAGNHQPHVTTISSASIKRPAAPNPQELKTRGAAKKKPRLASNSLQDTGEG